MPPSDKQSSERSLNFLCFECRAYFVVHVTPDWRHFTNWWIEEEKKKNPCDFYEPWTIMDFVIWRSYSLRDQNWTLPHSLMATYAVFMHNITLRCSLLVSSKSQCAETKKFNKCAFLYVLWTTKNLRVLTSSQGPCLLTRTQIKVDLFCSASYTNNTQWTYTICTRLTAQMLSLTFTLSSSSWRRLNKYAYICRVSLWESVQSMFYSALRNTDKHKGNTIKIKVNIKLYPEDVNTNNSGVILNLCFGINTTASVAESFFKKKLRLFQGSGSQITFIHSHICCFPPIPAFVLHQANRLVDVRAFLLPRRSVSVFSTHQEI